MLTHSVSGSAVAWPRLTLSALVELLIDRVIVTDSEVEIRYVFPTSSKGERQRFCRLRMDYQASFLNDDSGNICPVRACAFSCNCANRISRPAISPAVVACFDIFSPAPGTEEVISQTERLRPYVLGVTALPPSP